MLPQRAEDLEMTVPREPRLDQPVLADTEARQRGGDGAIGEVGTSRAHPRLERFQCQMIEPWRRQRGQTRVPRGEPLGQLDDATVDTDDAAHVGGVAPAVFEDDVAAPRLPGQDRPREPERFDHRPKIADGDVHVVARLGRVGASVPALIQGDHGVTVGVKSFGDAIPQPEIRGQPMDEHERHERRITFVALGVQGHVRRDRSPQLDGRVAARLAVGVTHRGLITWSSVMVERGLPPRKPCHATIGASDVLPGGMTMGREDIRGIAGVLIWTERDRFDAMARFYRDRLGLTPRSSKSDFINFDWDGVRLSVSVHDRVTGTSKDPFRIMINLAVDDVRAVHARLTSAGVVFVRTPETEDWGGQVASFLDPDGNLVQLFQLPPTVAR